MINSGFPATSSKQERLSLTQSSSSSVSRKNKVEELSKDIAANIPPHHNAKFSLIASRPLGIGLHLNSLVSGQKFGHTVTSNAKVKSCDLSTTKSCSSIEKVKSIVEESRHDINTIVIHATATVKSPHGIEAQNLLSSERCVEESTHDIDDSITHISSKRVFNLEQAESSEEINQMSPKKKM